MNKISQKHNPIDKHGKRATIKNVIKNKRYELRQFEKDI